MLSESAASFSEVKVRVKAKVQRNVYTEVARLAAVSSALLHRRDTCRSSASIRAVTRRLVMSRICGVCNTRLSADELVDENNNVVTPPLGSASKSAIDNGVRLMDGGSDSSTSFQCPLEPTICCNCISEPSVEEWVSEDEDDDEHDELLAVEYVRDDIEILVDIYLLIEKARWLLHSILW